MYCRFSFTKNLLNARYKIIICIWFRLLLSITIGSLFGLLTAFNRTIEFFHFISSWYFFFFYFPLWLECTHTISNEFVLFCFVLAFEAKTSISQKWWKGWEKFGSIENSFIEQVGNNKRLTNKTIFFIRLSFVENNNNNNSFEINTVGSLHNHFQCLLHRIEERINGIQRIKKNEKIIMKCGKELFIRFHEWFGHKEGIFSLWSTLISFVDFHWIKTAILA